jgi:hypothetical protein
MSDPDEQYGRALLRPLADAPDAPSRVDLVRARTVGRRRRRTRRAVTAGAAVAVVVLAATTVPALVRTLADPDRGAPADVGPPVPSLVGRTDCTLTQLPLPPGREAEVIGGDPTLRYLVGLDRNQTEAYVWRDGQLVGRPPKDAVPPFVDVNGSGLAVTANGAGKAVDPKDRPLAGEDIEVVAVNEAGTIAGSVARPGSGLGGPSVPVTWASPSAQPFRLRLPTGETTGQAVDIGEDGKVLGTVGTDGLAYLWSPDGAGAYLPKPGLPQRELHTLTPVAIRGDWVVGHAVDGADGKRVALLLNLTAMTYREVPGAAGRVTDVAADGSVTVDGPAVLIKADGQYRTTPDVVAGRPITGMTATTVAADGSGAAGRVVDDQDRYHPVVWSCR